MLVTSLTRSGMARFLGGLALLNMIPSAIAQTSFVQDGKAGFVVSYFEYALSNDAEQTGACPDGMTQGYNSNVEAFINKPSLERVEAESDADYELRRFRYALTNEPQNYCMHPELAVSDSRFRTVNGANIPVYGIDLDGQDSRTDGSPAEASCAHDDFAGMRGGRGIDNQFFRVVGCTTSFQPRGQSNDLTTEMLTGSWGILVTVDDVDDIRNDDSVEVGFYANADPIQLSPTREPVAYASYAFDRDPRFRASARGRIVDGILMTEPTDVRFHSEFVAVRTERPLRDAQLHATISEDGVLEGYLAGYTSLEDMYDVQFGFRNGTDNLTGEPGSVYLINSRNVGEAVVMGNYTCEGVYYALYGHADGHPDPETGKCTSISTQYRIKALPAFVVDGENS